MEKKRMGNGISLQIPSVLRQGLNGPTALPALLSHSWPLPTPTVGCGHFGLQCLS